MDTDKNRKRHSPTGVSSTNSLNPSESVFIRVCPWLNCLFQDQSDTELPLNRQVLDRNNNIREAVERSGIRPEWRLVSLESDCKSAIRSAFVSVRRSVVRLGTGSDHRRFGDFIAPMTDRFGPADLREVKKVDLRRHDSAVSRPLGLGQHIRGMNRSQSRKRSAFALGREMVEGHSFEDRWRQTPQTEQVTADVGVIETKDFALFHGTLSGLTLGNTPF